MEEANQPYPPPTRELIETLCGQARATSQNISAAELALLDLALVVKAEGVKLATVEGILKQQVNEARTGEGITAKALYTNDAQRSTALLALKTESKSFIIASADLAKAERTQAEARIELDRLHRQFSLDRLAFEAVAIGRRN